MAFRLIVNPRFIKSFPLQSQAISSSNHDIRLFLCKSFAKIQEPYKICNPLGFCSSTLSPRLSWESSAHEVLSKKLEFSLKEHKLPKAWETFNDFRKLYGLPSSSLVGSLVTELCYSSSPNWLRKAADLVLKVSKKKPDFLPQAVLNKVVLSFARAQMPIPCSMILRLMLERKDVLPPMNVLCLIVLHMVKTEIGACIASNFLVQICDSFLRLSAEKSYCAKGLKPDTMIFNLVLKACVRFGSSLKGQKIVESMAQTGVIADAHSIILVARLHEMNGQRDEIRRFKDHIPFFSHYQQFFDSLLSLHFKFGDIDAAAALLLDMIRQKESRSALKPRNSHHKPCFVPIGSDKIRNGLMIQIVPELQQKDSVLNVDTKSLFVIASDGKLLPSNKALAKLVLGYRRLGKISELSKLLLSFTSELGESEGSTICEDVIYACIELGWLETAHDILDDMECAGDPVVLNTYRALLTAYYKQNMSSEGNALLRKMKKRGLVSNLSDELVVSAACQSGLRKFLVQEMQEEETAIPPGVFELNSTIYFFCKAKMIEDALKVYWKMQEMGIKPTVHTFAHLIDVYSSLEMYRDITILWGDVKRSLDLESGDVHRDLYEFLLMNFLRGGYFERVMEVIGFMESNGCYADKWMYKSEYFKHHKNLYRRLIASDARTEAQAERLEHVRAFKRWARSG